MSFILPLIRAELDRLTKITVCTRPFRAHGPRIEAERLGDKLIVHNYGHGGSGWSLSWGSGTEALNLALAGRDPSTTDLAVIGCGALGLTAALLAQRAGCRSVTIYTRDPPTATRSFNATGAWTPDSRVALTSVMAPRFCDQWETMARTSWATYQKMLQHPSHAVEFTDRYTLSNLPPAAAEQAHRDADPIGFAYLHHRLDALMPPWQDLDRGQHPFPTRWARRSGQLTFNITELIQQLTNEFQQNGGQLLLRELHTPSELQQLSQPVILHSTGYAARALFGDTSLTPVRGQIAWLPAQPEVRHSVYLDNLNIVSRRDGVVVQWSAHGEATGWTREDEHPDPDEAAEGLHRLERLQQSIKATATEH